MVYNKCMCKSIVDEYIITNNKYQSEQFLSKNKRLKTLSDEIKDSLKNFQYVNITLKSSISVWNHNRKLMNEV